MKLISLLFVIIAILVGGVITKLFWIDSFHHKLISSVPVSSMPDNIEILRDLPDGYYVSSRVHIPKLLTVLGYNITPRVKYLAIRGSECIGFQPEERHGVKGDVLIKASMSNVLYVYEYNPRFDIPFDVPMKGLLLPPSKQ
jgi:hypothetical protein